MLDVKNIILSEEELSKCVEFARRSAPTQQAIEFGQRTTKERSNNEIARDNLIGKIAEVAFSKMMKENYNIDVPLDFNYYPRGKWDDQDSIINGWRIDVKGTRKGGHWFLIEWSKLNFRQKENKLSHVYAMFSVDWNRNTDLPTGQVSYEGAVSLSKLRDNCSTTKILRKGDFIPGTHAILQADNYAVHFRDLYKHLNHLVAYLLKEPPAKSITDNFKNPYNGQTTRELLSDKLNILETNEKRTRESLSFVKKLLAKFSKNFNK